MISDRNLPLVLSRLGISFNIDSPVGKRLVSGKVLFEGWVVAKYKVDLELINNDNVSKIILNVPRPDVAEAVGYGGNFGFSKYVDIQEGSCKIILKIGLFRLVLWGAEVVNFDAEAVTSLHSMIGRNLVEHDLLMEDRKEAYYEANNFFYDHKKSSKKIIAFYLPQFHPIEINDTAWEKNFTEWTNVTTAHPRFVGHNQPFLPKDTGFYDLRIEQNMLDQINLAKSHGLYGFCFYYYWFSGEKIMDTPINNFIKNKDWDFNFMICWANENWTKRWDGRDQEVIISQKYSNKDPLKFIKDVEHILLDPRYIRHDGKPVLAVYRASELKDPDGYQKIWRDYFRKNHKTDLFITTCISFDAHDPRSYGFDASIDFSPQSIFFKGDTFANKKLPILDVETKKIDINFQGQVCDYREIIKNNNKNNYFDFPTIRSIMPSWDNDARKKGSGFVMTNVAPFMFEHWLSQLLEMDVDDNNPTEFVFINAWNEWAEGTVLEPTRHNGYAILNSVSRALMKVEKGIKSEDKIAIVIHLYHTDRWQTIKDKIKSFKAASYDLYVSINKDDCNITNKIREDFPEAHIYTVPNRGRDVLPFINILRIIKNNGYRKILKIHSKKTKHRDNGDDWFNELLSVLLPENESDQVNIIKRLDKPSIIGPAEHNISLGSFMGSNMNNIQKILSMLHVDTELDANNYLNETFFSGTMFWANVDYLQSILDLYLIVDDFDSESGQIDGTTAHALERIFGILGVINKIPNSKYLIDKDSVIRLPQLNENNDSVYKFAKPNKH